MKFRYLLLISLLMLLTIIGVIVIKSSSSLFFIKDELIAYFGENYQIDLKVRKASFWPLNQITLEEVEITSLDKRVLLAVPTISIKYNIFQVFESSATVASVINYVKMDNPRLMITGNPGEKVTMVTEDYLEELLTPFWAAPFQLIVNNGTFQYCDHQNDFSLENLSLVYQKINKVESRVRLNTHLEITRLKKDDDLLQDLQLSNLEVNLTSVDKNWQANLKTDNIDLDKWLTLSSYFSNLPVKITNPAGRGRINLNFSGKGLEIVNYNGNFNIENGSGVILLDEYFERASIEQLTGEVLFSSGDNILFFKDCYFRFQETPYHFDGSIRLVEGASPQIVGKLLSQQFEPSLFFQQSGFLKEFSPLAEIKGKGFLELTIAGTLVDPDLSLEFYLIDGRLAEQELDNLQVFLRYRHGYLYLDTFNLFLNKEALISAQGLYNTETAEFSMELTGRNLTPALIPQQMASIDNTGLLNGVEGKVNLVSSITGRGFKLADLNIYGQVEASSVVINGFDVGLIEGGFWLADNKLLLIDTGNEQLSLSGEIDLADNTLQLDIKGNELRLSSLQERLNLKNDNDLFNRLSGILSLKGTITQTIENPLLDLQGEVVKGKISDQQFDNLQFDLQYSGQKIIISHFKLSQKESYFTGEGSIDISGEEPYLSLQVNGDNVYEQLGLLAGQPLPLEGEATAALQIEGPVTAPRVRGHIVSSNTVLKTKPTTLPLDELQLSVLYIDNVLFIQSLQAEVAASHLQVTGEIVDRSLDLQFTLKEFNLQKLSLGETISGRLDLTGSISGEINAPEVEGLFSMEEVAYQGIVMDAIGGRFQYLKGDLLLNDIIGTRDDSSYLLQGQIYDLPGEKRFSLTLTTEKGRLYHFYNPQKPAFPLPEDYFFKGFLELGGNLNSPLAQLDLVFESKDGTENIKLKGQLRPELALSIEGQGVEVGKLPFFQKQDVAISGRFDFSGELGGTFSSLDLILNTSLSEPHINNYSFEGAQGVIKVVASKVIDIQQQLFFAEEKRLEINGVIPLQENGNGFNLKIKMNGFPLELVSSYYPSFPETGGFLIGELDLTGSINEPSLNGDLYLVDGRMDLKLPDIFTNLRGSVLFSGKEITFSNLKGQYGDGDIILQGTIYPFSQENYAITVSGSNLPFDYGSFKGRFDPEIEISGSFEAPFIKAKAITHHFNIGLPVQWPVKEGGKLLDFDIVLEPGEEVYVLNNNIEVLIQKGSLRIVSQDNQVEYEGLLESEQGTFDYYNNKFLVSEARATFNRYNGFIPELYVRASTRVKGTIIEVVLSGQSDNLLITLNSQPPLEEKEILTLLTSKGGLGEFVTGNFENIITKELMRLVYNYLQLDVVKNIQSTFKETFRLDRFELDTYNLGWDQEIAIYLGKYLNDRLYLQYSSTITPDQQDNELALRYYLTDYLHFESSWQGEDNYSWSLQTNIEF